MSGSTGADRIKSRNDFQQFLKSYKDVISTFPGFISMTPSGSYNSNLAKNDFGDIDLIVHIESQHDKATVKKELVNFFNKMPDTVIVPFSSAKHAGRKTYNAGELITVRYHDDTLGYSSQIDNIIALDKSEASFKQQFLDLDAPKQGLVLGLVKIAAIESNPRFLFQQLGIDVKDKLEDHQEYEFNLSSIELQLRKVTYAPGTFKQINREILWTSRNFEDLQTLLYRYDIRLPFDDLLKQAKQTIKNPRSNNRLQGIFGSMISVKSGEVGTAKGDEKNSSLAKIKNTFGSSMSEHISWTNFAHTENKTIVENANKTVVFAFGRFQPPTTGHGILVDAVKNAAKQHGADHVIYVSKTQDKKTNPLSIDVKMHYLRLMFPGTNFVATDQMIRTPIEAVKNLNKKYTNLIMVAGSDRVPSFTELFNKYNGVEYTYDSISVISAGERDPDSDDAQGMSGTKMRAAALQGKFKTFRQGLPGHIHDNDATRLMNAVVSGLAPMEEIMNIREISNALTKSYMKGAMRDTIGGKKDRNPGIKRAMNRLSGTNKPLLHTKNTELSELKLQPGQTSDFEYKGWNCRYQLLPKKGSYEHAGMATHSKSEQTKPIRVAGKTAEEVIDKLKFQIDHSRGSNIISAPTVTIDFNAQLARDVIGHGNDIYADIIKHGDQPLLLLSNEDHGGMHLAMDRTPLIGRREGKIGQQAFRMSGKKATLAGLTHARYGLGKAIGYMDGITAIPLEFRSEVYPGEVIKMGEPGLTIAYPRNVAQVSAANASEVDESWDEILDKSGRYIPSPSDPKAINKLLGKQHGLTISSAPTKDGRDQLPNTRGDAMNFLKTIKDKIWAAQRQGQPTANLLQIMNKVKQQFQLEDVQEECEQELLKQQTNEHQIAISEELENKMKKLIAILESKK